ALSLEPCPGAYCARLNSSNGWSSCGPCPAGHRSDQGFCRPCDQPASAYMWLYLGFMALIPVLCNMIFLSRSRGHKRLLLLAGLCALESVLAALASVLVFPPRGSPYLTVCGVNNLSDWYPVFFNPDQGAVTDRPAFEAASCAHEVVYPLYSIVLTYYAFCVLFLLLMRPVAYRLLGGSRRYVLYAPMFLYPLLALLHSISGGLLYFAFPYLLLLCTLLSHAVFLLCQIDPEQPAAQTSAKWMLRNTLLKPLTVLLLLVHWLFLGVAVFSIVAAKPADEASGARWVVAAVPLPYLLFVATLRFSHPDAAYMAGDYEENAELRGG
ncbi:hypothetical protein BOX15_Mlig002823g1, partial [Macrostomum lignano]